MTVKEARKCVGLTQKALSEWLGIPKRTIEDWDSGKSNLKSWIKNLLIEKILSYKGDNKMRVFEVVSIKIRANGEYGDEYQSYLGFDFEKAEEAYKSEVSNYELLSESDKKSTCIEARVYAIDDTVDVNDVDELTNALCECIGYDFFELPINE